MHPLTHAWPQHLFLMIRIVYEQYVCSVPSFIIVNGELKPSAARRSGVVKNFQHITSNRSGPVAITSESDFKRQSVTYILVLGLCTLVPPKVTFVTNFWSAPYTRDCIVNIFFQTSRANGSNWIHCTLSKRRDLNTLIIQNTIRDRNQKPWRDRVLSSAEAFTLTHW